MDLPGNATEEDVKVKFLVPFLRKLGYLEECIDYEVAINVQEGTKRKTIFADAVVYTSNRKTSALAVYVKRSGSKFLFPVPYASRPFRTPDS